ncbi:MAG: SdrD B-like domain-containing protein [Candidatus Thiothrix putei]|uniref:SdrD B-like domain-containing protein n=1 Tax=Candidatus Thiothrix putei TaxID=3080811 RepID=A0AA95HCY4_9GAMM|nr:MAG: SdrD B-like domain-containing protein [Candidatus Thiothrix putei]
MPKRRYANGSLGFSLQILFALLLLTVLTGQAFAANCTATYTQTSTGGSNNYTLTSGQSLKIASGTYTGTVEFGSGASICVETGATFTPGNLNNVAGTLTNYGTANLQTFSYNSGTVIDNYGTLSFIGGLNTNGAMTFRNRANATMTMANSFQLGNNSTFINDGLVIAAQDFNTQNGTTLTNNYRLEMEGNFNPDGTFNNYGRVYAKKFINMNSNSTITNYCTFVSYDGYNNNSPRTANFGTILITQANGTPGGPWQNNQEFYNAPNAKIAGGNFTNNSTFTGGGSLIFSGSTTNQGPFNGDSASNKINFYDETQTSNKFFDNQNTTPTNTVRTAFVRPTELDSPETCTSSYRNFANPNSYDFGDAPASYGDASHVIVAGLKLGTNAPDSESASQPTHNASGDGADEDGAPKAPSNSSITRFPLLKQTDTSYSSTFKVTNTTGTAGKLYGWIDFDKNGTFEADEATSVNVPTGANDSSVTLNWSSIPADIKPGTSFIRLRLTTDTAVTTSTPTGNASNGEVEDFPIAIALSLPPNSPSVSVTKGTTPTSCTTTVFSDNFNDLTGGQYFAENRPGATPIRNWVASGGGADTRNRTDGMHNATHGTSIYMDSGAIRRIFPAIPDTPSVDSNGVITTPPTALELRDTADDLTPNTTSGDSHWGPLPPSLSRTLNTTVGQRYRLYFELLPENDGNGWRNGMLRVDTPSGSVHLQTPAGTGSPYLYQVDFTANAATSTISFVNYSRLAIDDNWCDPLTTAWCTIDGLSTTPKTSEPMIDNVVVALESACVSTSTQDYGDAPASYGNPSHVITPNLMIGNHVDTESGALHSVNADGDDNNGSTDDEDGLHNPAIIPTTQGQTYTLTTYVKNETGSTAYLRAYLDFNRDGDFLDAGEQADTQHVYWNGYFQSTFTVPAGTTAGTTYARLRLSQTKSEAEVSIGSATSGEVEDHKLTISAGPFYDFGDSPASYGSARHTILNSLFLGANRPDSETASQYSYNAIGDGVDEDGAPKQYNNPTITLFPILKMTATSYSVDIRTTNTTGSAGKLYGWIDFDKSGTFDADEAASANVANNTNGTVTLTWNSIPTDIKLGTTFIRLRLTTDPAVTTSTPANNANNGEVEDFPIAVAIDVPPDSPDVTIVRGDGQTCSSTIFTDNFDDLASEQYFGANTSATPFVIRNWTATGGGSDTYARTVEVSPFAATQGRSIYFGNGMMRRFYPDTSAVLAFDGNGRMLEPPDAVELRDDVDDVSPGVNIHESHWGPEPVTLSRTFASTAGQRYRLYFSAIPEGGDWNSGIMRVDTPSGSVHFKAPGKDEGIQKYRIEFTATGASSTIRFVNYGHIGTDGGWCDPNSIISGPWCTVGGFPTDKKGNELIIDDVTVALASACPTSGISGTVYTDTNGNNAFDGATETGLANISVSLYDNNGTTATTSDDNLMATTSTAANGTYSFASISPTLRYRVEVDSRDADLPASAVIGTTNPLANIAVTAGNTLSNQNFGFDLACNASAGQFGGIAFRDYNQNGIREPQEEGIAGITVTAYNSANAVAATATTDARGWYTLNGLTNGTQYRLEYTNLPSGLYPGAAGTDTASTVRFVTASGSCAANLGISDPIEYCQAIPPVAAFNFVNGNPSIADIGNYASLFTFPYDATGGAYDQTPPAITKANTSQTGALWGLAYQKTTKTLYASAAMRRFSGFGALGTGGIYKVDMTDPNAAYTGASTYVDLRAIGIDTGNDVRVATDSCNNLATGVWSPSHDVAAWDKVGKVGVGDIDYDEPNNRLWLINLNDRKLYGIGNVSPTTAPTAANVLGGYAVNLPSPYACTSGTFRPWAVKYHRGYVYVGGVCDAATDPYNLSKVRGYVLRFNPANTAAGFSHVKDFAINQPRSGFGYTNIGEWSGWLPQADAVNVRPQFHSPIVGNLEFDTDGSIIVGIIDRAGLQKGTNSYDEPACGDPTIDYVDTMGDVLRLCKTDTGYLNDSEPGCSTAIATNSKTTDEYYWGDLGPSNNAWEGMNEIAAGGLALAPGKEHVLASAYDANSWGSNGVVWLNNRTGAKDNSYHVSWSTLGKSTGMGELEVLCDPSPVEVGNRVWLDADKDGLQDANEAGIANVTVTLACGADNATTTTNAQGEYYFSNKAGGNATFMGSGESCSLSVNTTQTSLNTYTLTTQNADNKTDNNSQTDIRDSDATVSGGNAVINFTVGSSGQNNHGLDFGYQANTSTEPPTSWTSQRIIDDCHGTSSYNPNGADGAENAPCQSYAQDIYENWNPAVAGAGDTDIKQCRLGYYDGTEQYYFFAWQFRENWNYDNTGASREYHLELDTDHDATSPETPARSDLFIRVQPRSTYQGSTWHAVGNGDAIIYKDANNDVGCANPGQKDTKGCSTGYEADYSINQGDAFVRILNGQVELAIKAGVVDGLNNVKARCYASQTSTLSKDKLDWHDQNDASDLSSYTFDSTGFAEVGPNATAGTISGTVYTDSNGNDTFDSATEAGINAISVTLLNAANNATVSTTDTAANGAYSFNNISSTLTYQIRVNTADADLPAGAMLGTINPLTGVTVTAGGTTANKDFGFDPAPTTMAECLGVFPGPINIHDPAGSITLGSSGKIYGTTNNTLITPTLIDTTNTKCDAATCKQSGTVAKKLAFNVKRGDGSDGPLNIAGSSTINIVGDKNYSAVTVDSAVTINITGPAIIHIVGNLDGGVKNSNSSTTFNITGDVEIHADKIKLGSSNKFELGTTGSLRLFANSIEATSSAGNAGVPAWRFGVFSKGDITVVSSPKLNGYWYAGGSIIGQLSSVTMSGSWTAASVTAGSSMNLTYAGDNNTLCALLAQQTGGITGKVFEDMNYGGGAGRPFGTAGTVGVSGARVELYNAAGNFMSSTTTDTSGVYNFTSVTDGAYYVRAVNDTVKSTRTGANGTERGIQTFRTDGTTDVVNEIGGRKPSSADAPANTTNQTLNTATFTLSGGGQAQSVQPITIASTDITGANFGFNFNTVVNTNDSGQGSLRQFILNANLLGNDSTLAQTGRTAGKDNAILELSTSDLNYNAANQYWSIAVQSALPALGNDIILDASTQPARTTAPTFTFANRPVIELNGSNAGDYTNGLALNGATNGSTVKYFAINRFKMAGIQVVQSKNNLIASNYIGTDPTGAINRGNGDSGITVISPLGPNLIGGSSSAGNLIAYNGGDGIKVGGTDGTKATSMLGNKIYANGKLGIDLGGNGITVNDANDADTGTNDLINFPMLATITESGGNLTLKGCAPAGATIELFEADVSAGGKATPGANKFGKSKDYGEGQTYLDTFVEGSASDTDTATCAIATDTDGNNHTGMNAFTITIPTPAGFVTGDSMTATATLSNSGTSEFSPTVLLLEAYNVAGKIYEDVNYGGGNGRAFNAATAGMTGISGASVELRDASNNVFATTTSTADGSYTFTNIPVGVYSVQVVNASVRSTRSGSNGSERGVITYRTDGVNNVSTASTAFSQAITLSNANLSNVSFGFNFDTITNTNDSGAGSLRQFILNANVLGDDSSLAQVGRTAGKENAILELSTTDDPNYNTGYWSIPLQSALPPITAPIVLDGALPQGSNSNPTLELNGTNAGGAANGLALSAGASSSTLRKLAINGFSGAGIYLNGSDNNYLLANYIGITPAGIPRGNTGSGIRLDTASANKIGSTINGDGNIIANNTGNGITIAGSKADTLLNSILGNSIYANGGLGIDLVGGTEIGSVTTNDTKDIDEGPNHLLNYPEVKVNSFGVNGTKIVTYDFNLDVPAGDYRLEFFVSADKDDSGHGEGQTFIGSKDISHPGTESLNFKGTFNANMTVAKGTFISATLTQKSNATTFGSTSEFSGIQDGITTQVCDSLITGTAGNIVIDETNTATIIQLLEAKDSNGNPITYVISGGADGNFFTIVNPTPGATLDCATVKFLTSNVIITKSARDNNEAEARATLPGTLPPAGNYELPLDKDQDNVYELQITATTADGKKYVRDLNVRVMDINEAPSITSASLVLTNEDSNADVMMVQAQDPDVGDKLTYRISSGADSSHFEINATTGILRFRAIPDYDAPMDANRDNTYEIEITVTDKGGLSSKKLFQIRIVNNTADDGVVINVRALLQGPYDNKTALMSANLNTLGLLPNKHPYQAFGHAGAETLSTMLKETTGNNAVVDWALVELRTSPGSVVASRAVILQRDGDLVDAQTGSPNLHFANIKAGNYYVSVRHRNHLGVVSASPVSLDNSAKMLDFAASSTVVRGEESRFVSGKLAWMWAGDINGSHTLTANGPGNDVTSLLSGVITSMDNLQGNTNHILSGYLATDLNFDGKTLFTGPGNDTSLLVGNILLHPLNTGFAANYIVKGGLQ